MKFRDTIFFFMAVTLIMACKPEPVNQPSDEELGVPSGLKCTSVNAEGATISWDAVKDAASYKYKLLKGMTLVANEVVPGTEISLTGLESKTAYKFAVKTCGKGTESKYSDYLEFTTSAEETVVPEPDPVEGLYESLKIPVGEDNLGALAFPGAEGGGMYTTGGRGGKILHVTSLSDSNDEGTLRWAVGQKGARTVVFDVAGTITLTSPLNISNGDLTIAGQTAPGDGICIKGRYTRISADNIIIRFLRFRLGDEGSPSDSDDAIWGRYQKNIIIDHCSMSWSVDECASFYSNSNFTMQWCYIAESMRSSIHSKGNHGYGGIWGGENASFHHNVLAHHDSRNPRFDHPHIYENHTAPAQRGVIDYRNNVVYDWGNDSSYGGEGYGSGKGTGINMIGNTYKPGTSSSDRHYFLNAYGVYAKCSDCGSNIEEGYPLTYMEGNVHTRYSDISVENALGIYWHDKEGHKNYQETASKAFPVLGPEGQSCYTTTHNASDAFEAVVNWGGASLRRDAVDRRTSDDVKNGKGCIIDCVKSTAGKSSVQDLYGVTWPVLKATEEELQRVVDTDGDGIPDYYESLFGLDRNNPSDASKKSIDKKGRYTNFEIYLHYLVRDLVAGGNEKGTYTENN